MPNIIRPVQKGDRKNWEQLFQAYADFYQVELLSTHAPFAQW